MADRYPKLQEEILAELKAIRSVLEQDTGIQAEPACPHCGGTDLENTSTMGDRRSTCRGCGQSFGQEVVRG